MWSSGPQTDKHRQQSPFTGQLKNDDILHWLLWVFSYYEEMPYDSENKPYVFLLTSEENTSVKCYSFIAWNCTYVLYSESIINAPIQRTIKLFISLNNSVQPWFFRRRIPLTMRIVFLGQFVKVFFIVPSQYFFNQLTGIFWKIQILV